MATSAPDATARIIDRALLSRLVEERLLQWFADGKLSGTVHTCIGQELVGAVVAECWRPGDAVFSNHRGHGHFLAVTGEVEALLAEVLGRTTGACGGMGGSQHLCQGSFFSNGIQGGIVPVAAGLALGAKLAKRGGIAIVFIGDGTLGEGVIYEAFNLAARWSLPLLVVLEENGIAQSTRTEETLAGSVAARAEGFGLRYASADTWAWPRLHAAAVEMAASVRRGDGPGLLHVRTYRLKGHSKGDDTRPREEVAAFEHRDPVNGWLADPELATAGAAARARVDEAAARAEAAPLACYTPPAGGVPGPAAWCEAHVPKERVVRALNQFFHAAMGRDESIFMLGEDVESPYGGAFKVTQGLSDAYPGRVHNTPISEAGIVGLGAGLALAGRRPVVEIMFGDFLGLAFDQLVNHAAKFERMYHGQVHVDLVVRTPMGGRRGYGPTHSQTLDRHFLGVPGLRVLALNHLLPPETLYGPLFQGHLGATLVLENKLLYGAYLRAEHAPGFALLASQAPFPTAWLRPAARRVDITLLGYGGMSELLATATERLFEQHDLVAQMLCPMQICPFDIVPLLPMIAAADRLLIVEEGQGFAGFGAEVMAQLMEFAPEFRGRTARLAPPPDIIPASIAMERTMLPSLETLLARAVALCA